jgi:hypothetical protein
LNDIAFDHLEYRADVAERFLIDLILTPVDDVIVRLLPCGKQVFYDEGLIRELFEVFVGKFGRLGRAFFYFLRLGLFLTFLELGRIQFFFSTRSMRISSRRITTSGGTRNVMR